MVSGPQGLQKSQKEDRIPKNAYAFAPGLLCLLQKIQKVCRLEHSVLFFLALLSFAPALPQGRNEKLFFSARHFLARTE